MILNIWVWQKWNKISNKPTSSLCPLASLLWCSVAVPSVRYTVHSLCVLQAGLVSPDCPEQLLIALEPEAASIYCRKLRLHQVIDLSMQPITNGLDLDGTRPFDSSFRQGRWLGLEEFYSPTWAWNHTWVPSEVVWFHKVWTCEFFLKEQQRSWGYKFGLRWGSCSCLRCLYRLVGVCVSWGVDVVKTNHFEQGICFT